MEIGDHDRTIGYFKKGMTILGQDKIKHAESYFPAYQNLIDLYLKQNLPDTATNHLNNLLSEAKVVLSENDELLADQFRFGGAVYDEIGKTKEAILMTKKALSIHLKEDPDSKALIDIYNNLGIFYQGDSSLLYSQKSLDLGLKHYPLALDLPKSKRARS